MFDGQAEGCNLTADVTYCVPVRVLLGHTQLPTQARTVAYFRLLRCWSETYPFTL
jgi:hypothetical protein